MGINGFQLRRHLSLTAYRVHAFSLHITFQLVAMQLAAAISAFCLPLMILDKALPLLGFSPVIKGTDETKDKPSRNKVTVVANSASQDSPGHHNSNPVVVKTAWGEYLADGSYEKLTEHEAGWLKAYYQTCIEVWRPYKIEPCASKSPAYQKKLDLVLTEQCAQKCDMATVSFAKFVCAQKGLPYVGLMCVTVMMTDKFLQLDPPA